MVHNETESLGYRRTPCLYILAFEMAIYALLRIRLTPRGGRDVLVRYEDGVLHARVSAAPVDGAANRALIALLAETLDVPKSRIRFHSGETGRDKVVRIEGVEEIVLRERIKARLKDEG